ncbi:MAG: polysaccharide biosynthesis/export family protein [Planctomycetales bacterium]
MPIVWDSLNVPNGTITGGFPMKKLPTGRRENTSGKLHTALCLVLTITSVSCLALSGCMSPTLREAVADAETADHPRELQKVSIPPYRVEPPDILSIDIVNNIRPADDPLRAGDELVIRASGLPPVVEADDPVIADFKTVNGVYRVQSDGTVDLGPEYGSVPIDGLTVVAARQAIETHFREALAVQNPRVALSMPNVNGKQLIAGEHLVRPDGTVALGVYGSVYVAGMTLDEIKETVETHLSRYIHDPEVQVDVLSYNSKKVYVITDGGGSGESVTPLPFTGNETVLDAIAQIQGLSEVSSKRMWIARPAPAESEVAQTMQIDWRAITQDGNTLTNYQLLPGDRVFIQADKLVAADNFIAKVTVPISRLFGFTLLGYSTIGRVQGPLNAGQGLGGAGGFGGIR